VSQTYDLAIWSGAGTEESIIIGQIKYDSAKIYCEWAKMATMSIEAMVEVKG
jgi:hypothetical protein